MLSWNQQYVACCNLDLSFLNPSNWKCQSYVISCFFRSLLWIKKWKRLYLSLMKFSQWFSIIYVRFKIFEILVSARALLSNIISIIYLWGDVLLTVLILTMNQMNITIAVSYNIQYFWNFEVISFKLVFLER